MGRVTSRLFVIDASVARSCGTGSTPPAPQCTLMLNTILTVCHRAALSQELKEEWDKHGKRSRYFTRWWKDMTSRRKIVPQQLRRLSELKGRIGNVADQQNIPLLDKDAHLVAAAIQDKARVIALDDHAREHFAELTNYISELDLVIWINPQEETPQLIAWLESGAPDEPFYRISNLAKPGNETV